MADIGVDEVENDLRFPGQYFDGETGLHYNYRRDYSPLLGRYMQSDPLGLYDGPNTYVYVKNNPLFSADPKGLASISLGGNAPSKGPFGGGGEVGITEITCCRSGRTVKQRYAYYEVGPSVGLSAAAGVNVSVNLKTSGSMPSCGKPTPTPWRFEILVFSISNDGVDVGMRWGLAYRYNVTSGYRLVDEYVTGECC